MRMPSRQTAVGSSSAFQSTTSPRHPGRSRPRSVRPMARGRNACRRGHRRGERDPGGDDRAHRAVERQGGTGDGVGVAQTRDPRRDGHREVAEPIFPVGRSGGRNGVTHEGDAAGSRAKEGSEQRRIDVRAVGDEFEGHGLVGEGDAHGPGRPGGCSGGMALNACVSRVAPAAIASRVTAASAPVCPPRHVSPPSPAADELERSGSSGARVTCTRSPADVRRSTSTDEGSRSAQGACAPR